MKRLSYHTQEKREFRLAEPKICTNNTAWLGDAYYFWTEEIDSIQWGHNSKRATGSFEIYKAEIDTENVIDTVYNEDHYKNWLQQIEKAAKSIVKKTGFKPTLKEINAYFKKNDVLYGVDGVMFQDLPKGNDLLVVNFFYRKRIQIAVYNASIISNFTFHDCFKCNNR